MEMARPAQLWLHGPILGRKAWEKLGAANSLVSPAGLAPGARVQYVASVQDPFLINLVSDGDGIQFAVFLPFSQQDQRVGAGYCRLRIRLVAELRETLHGVGQGFRI